MALRIGPGGALTWRIMRSSPAPDSSGSLPECWCWLSLLPLPDPSDSSDSPAGMLCASACARTQIKTSSPTRFFMRAPLPSSLRYYACASDGIPKFAGCRAAVITLHWGLI